MAASFFVVYFLGKVTVVHGRARAQLIRSDPVAVCARPIRGCRVSGEQRWISPPLSQPIDMADVFRVVAEAEARPNISHRRIAVPCLLGHCFGMTFRRRGAV
jgi:hypothetical protein